ncbi:MAG TPA: hypothetical protein VFJ14_15700 [Nocardioidaceae bacterium]|nr:hypothetical protein [Nocardioidaceae bacterium]
MPQVRPRGIWTGFAAAIIGMVVVGVAMTVIAWRPWGWVGAALIAAGAVLGLLSGILQDVQGGSPGDPGDGEDTDGSEQRRGVRAGTKLSVPAPTPDSAVTVNAGAAQGAYLDPAPPSARLRFFAIAMVVLAAWMVLAPMLLHNLDTETGNDVVLRDYAVAGLLLVTGLALRDIRRHVAWCVIPAVCGAALLLATALSPPLTTRLTVNEAVCGVLAISLAAAYATLRLSRR